MRWARSASKSPSDIVKPLFIYLLKIPYKNINHALAYSSPAGGVTIACVYRLCYTMIRPL